MRLVCLSVVVTVAGCTEMPSIGTPPDVLSPVPVQVTSPSQVTPSLCGFYQWPSSAGFDAKLAIATYPNAAAVLAVPLGGGNVTGFDILGDGTTYASETVAATGTFSTVSVTVVDDQLAFAAGGPAGLELYTSDPLFLQPTEVGALPGSLVGETPVAKTRGREVAVSAGAAGVFVTDIDAQNQETARTATVSDDVTDFAAQSLADDVMFAWSTSTTCGFERVALGTSTTAAYACPGARLAVDAGADRGLLAFSADGATVLGRIDGHGFAGGVPMYGATSPRVAFDGTQFWEATLDTRGDVDVGILDSDDQLHRFALVGVSPNPDSFELAVFGGHTWLFAADDTTVDGYQLCTR